MIPGNDVVSAKVPDSRLEVPEMWRQVDDAQVDGTRRVRC